MKPDRPRVRHILLEFCQRGIVKGGELLLSPADALQLVEALRDTGVVVMGFDGWQQVSRGPDVHTIRQDLSVDVSVPDAVIQGPSAPAKAAEIVRRELQAARTRGVPLVSLTLDLPAEWSRVPPNCRG